MLLPVIITVIILVINTLDIKTDRIPIFIIHTIKNIGFPKQDLLADRTGLTDDDFNGSVFCQSVFRIKLTAYQLYMLTEITHKSKPC